MLQSLRLKNHILLYRQSNRPIQSTIAKQTADLKKPVILEASI